jgi:membrane dipeptidase
MRWLLSPLLSLLLLGAAAPAAQAADARAVHERIITLDTHLDTPLNFPRPGWDIADTHTWNDDFSQVDLPRMLRGGLDGGFFVVYTPQGPRTPEGHANARGAAILRAVQIREMVARHSDRFELALRADDAARIAASGKRIVFMSIENSYPLGADISLLKVFYDLGVRMVGPVHSANNELADSATDMPEWRGLSPLGRQLIAEANRLGMVLDASHASDDVFDQMLALSATPIILSHSGAKNLFDHPRNIDDERIRKLAAAGGVIQMNSLSAYLVATPANPERNAALQALGERYGNMRGLAGERLRAYAAERRAIEARHPIPRATLDDFMRQVVHVLRLVGPDHVGIGLDLDGGGGVIGMEDVADVPRITERLLAAGYSEADVGKIWSGNVLRLLRAAEARAAQR